MFRVRVMARVKVRVSGSGRGRVRVRVCRHPNPDLSSVNDAHLKPCWSRPTVVPSEPAHVSTSIAWILTLTLTPTLPLVVTAAGASTVIAHDAGP